MSVKVNKIATLTGHSAAVYTLDKGTDEHLIFSGGTDKILVQWNLETFNNKQLIASYTKPLYSICHIPEKQVLLTGVSNGDIYILDLHTKRELKVLKNHTSHVFCMVYSIKTNCFYSVGGDGYLIIYNLDTFEIVNAKKLSNEKIRHIDFNYETNEIAIAAADCAIRIFDLQTLLEKKNFIGHELSCNVTRFSPCGELLLTGGRDGFLNIWNVNGYKKTTSIAAHTWAIYDIAYSPDCKLFATASRDKTIKIWNSKNYKLLTTINKADYNGHAFSVNKLIWSSYKNYLISASDDSSIMVWDIKQN